MNKIAVALNVIGFLSIIGGIVLGFSTYQTPVPGYTTITEEDYGVLFTWIGAGVISGIMMFGFAEIVNILHDIRNRINGSSNDHHVPDNQEDNSKKNKFTDFVESSIKN